MTDAITNNDRRKYITPLPTTNGKPAAYFQCFPTVLGQPNSHLMGWHFSNGTPPNSNEAYFAGLEVGTVWALYKATSEEVEVVLREVGNQRTSGSFDCGVSHFKLLLTGPAHDHLRMEVTYGRQGWICLRPDLATSFTKGFLDAVWKVARLQRPEPLALVVSPVTDPTSTESE